MSTQLYLIFIVNKAYRIKILSKRWGATDFLLLTTQKVELLQSEKLCNDIFL